MAAVHGRSRLYFARPGDTLSATGRQAGPGGAGGKCRETTMRGDPRLMDDLSRLASGAMGTLNTMRTEVRDQMRERMRRAVGGADSDLREQLDAALEMAANARAEQEKLQERVDALEARLAKLESAAKPKAAPKRTPKSNLDGKKIAEK